FSVGMISIVSMIFTMVFNVTLPSYVYNTRNLTSIEFGVSDMLYGVGGLAAGMFSILIVKKIPVKFMILFLFFVLMINSIAFVLINTSVGLFVGSFILGYSISSIRVYMNTTRSEEHTSELQSR